MIDLLLVNPTANATKFIDYLEERKLTYKIVVTGGAMLGYVPQEHLIDLNINPIDTESTYKSAIAWNFAGQRFVEAINSQIVLANTPHQLKERLVSNAVDVPKVENSTIFETVTCKGKHVLLSAMIYKNGKWILFKDQAHPFFVDNVKRAFTELDSIGVLNGPALVFLCPTDKTCSIKLHPVDSDYIYNSVTNHFFDVWLPVLSASNPREAFDDWVERNGSNKTYQLV
jgi:hypothetical protein